jgi:hypothetical protein
MHYNVPLFILSVVIAIVAGTAALWAGTRVRSLTATIVASLIMGVAVSGMHYTGMAAMHVQADPMSDMAGMSGSSSTSFIVPLLAGISLLTFALTLIVSLSPTEDEITADTVLQRRMEAEFSDNLRVNPSSGNAFGGTSGNTFGGTSGNVFGGTSGNADQYPNGASGSDLGPAPGNVPRSSLVWSRQPRVGQDASHRRHPQNPAGR